MNQRQISRVVVCCFSFFCLACSPLEVVRLFGVGTRPFKQKGKVHIKAVNKDFSSAYTEVVSIFGQMKANLYRGSRRDGFIIFTNLSIAFPQASESTEVAVFLRECGPEDTRVGVSSLNHSLSDFVAEELFRKLEQ